MTLRGDLDIGAHFQPLHSKFCLVTHPFLLLRRDDDEDVYDHYDAADDFGDDGGNFESYGLFVEKYENLFAEKYDGVGNKQDLLLGT